MQLPVWKRVISVKFIVLLSAVASVVVLSQTSVTAMAPTSEITIFKSPIQTPIPHQSSLIPQAYLPVILNNFTAPTATTISRYINPADWSWSALSSPGCGRATTAPANTDLVVILDFGYQGYVAANNQYGIYLLNEPNTFRSLSEVTTATEAFIFGWYTCLPGGWSGSNTHLTLAIGVNNYDNGAVTNGHGIAWAQMINNINSWIIQPPTYGGIVTWGAIDAEPSWNTAANTRAWVDGYTSAYSWTLQSKYLNFGTCDGCPYFAHPDWIPPWAFDDIWYVSFGADPAYPLPEIYTVNGSNADQWSRLSLYSYTHYHTRMGFKGVLTQWNACQDQTDPNNCVVNGTNNSPGQGYSQLYYYINANPNTAQSLPWSSDISWQK